MIQNEDKHLHFEEEFLSSGKRQSRKERKRLSARDRSKYKKTDREKLQKRRAPPPTAPNLERGRVLATTADGILVDVSDHLYLCQLKGSLKRERTRIKNIIAIGDYVLIDPKDSDEGTITYIEERHSILSRIDPLSEHREQLLAVNIDQVLITVSVIMPSLKPYLIDRYIIAAKKGNMDPIIVINKVDYLRHPPESVDSEVLDEEKALFEEVMKTYQKLHIPIFAVSAQTGTGLEDLKQAMKDKTSVFSGQSGSGKSSLINATQGTSLLVGEVIQKTMKGSHTTTHSHLLPLDQGGFCIDTPGIRSFGLRDLSTKELQDYFQEISDLRPGCRFPDCAHLDEPDCAVKTALETNEISPLRFASYCALMQSIKEKFRRR